MICGLLAYSRNGLIADATRHREQGESETYGPAPPVLDGTYVCAYKLRALFIQCRAMKRNRVKRIREAKMLGKTELARLAPSHPGVGVKALGLRFLGP
jgi:hypothetical protein